MSKIAVTGGGGFVGTNLVKALVARGAEVAVIDDFSSGLRLNIQELDCEIHEISICNRHELERVLTDCDFIFHLAARGSVPRSIQNPDATFDVNVIGTLNILNFVKEAGIPIVFSSSSSVYGLNSSLPKNEFMWTAPMTPYAASKLCGEALVQSYSQSFHFPSLIFRFFNIFGPWQRPDHQYAAVIPKWIWKGMKKEVIQVHGDGEQTRDFTYVDTVTSSLLKVHDLGLTSPHPINLAFGRKVSLNSLLNQLLTFFPDLRVEYLPERQGDIRESQNDPRVLFDTLPNLDVISFEEGLRRTIGWMLENTTQFIPHFLPKD